MHPTGKGRAEEAGEGGVEGAGGGGEETEGVGGGDGEVNAREGETGGGKTGGTMARSDVVWVGEGSRAEVSSAGGVAA